MISGKQKLINFLKLILEAKFGDNWQQFFGKNLTISAGRLLVLLSELLISLTDCVYDFHNNFIICYY